MSDLISRQATIETFDCSIGGVPVESVKYVSEYADKMMSRINALPSAQPEPSDAVYRLYKRAYEAGQRNAQPEPHYDEWCTDCKEYDQERHRCPRWNKVIRETLKDAQSEIVRCKDCKYYKTKFCALDTWTNEITIYNAQPDDFCSRAKRRGENDG